MRQDDKRPLNVTVDGYIRFPRVTIGGLPVAVLDRQQTARLTIGAALSRRGNGRPCLFFTTVNGQVVSLCASDPAVKGLFEKADLISPDGMSVVFASRFVPGPNLPERVATTDAFHDAAGLAVSLGARFFLFGGTEDVNRRAADRVRKIYPTLAIVGRRSGYFDAEEEPAIVDEINAAAPDVLWVGLGVPHQQRFVVRNLHRLTSVGVAKSCGGLFDFLAGKNRRAPRWMQKAGLEWAFRASQEPRRLLWRYLATNPHAAFSMLVRSGGPTGEGLVEGRVNN
jgi:N-acetylglucosaminyldiphosphoundecaprenol N-acetyl-beta-D-mannosaminyltransferase